MFETFMELTELSQGDGSFNFFFRVGVVYATIALLGCQFAHGGYGKLSESASLTIPFELSPRVGWFIMELPAFAVFHYTYWHQPLAWEPARLLICALYTRQYLNRSFFFPWAIRLHSHAKKVFNLEVLFLGAFITALSGYLNAKWIGGICPLLSPQQNSTELSNLYAFNGLKSTPYVFTPFFLITWAFYEVAFWGLIYHEHLLRVLRPIPKPGAQEPGKRYKIPKGGLFEYITNATYFCELCIWITWALMTNNPAGVLMVVVTIANLWPRAFDQHRWYKEKFEDYPKQRKVIIPFIL